MAIFGLLVSASAGLAWGLVKSRAAYGSAGWIPEAWSTILASLIVDNAGSRWVWCAAATVGLVPVVTSLALNRRSKWRQWVDEAAQSTI